MKKVFSALIILFILGTANGFAEILEYFEDFFTTENYTSYINLFYTVSPYPSYRNQSFWGDSSEDVKATYLYGIKGFDGFGATIKPFAFPVLFELDLFDMNRNSRNFCFTADWTPGKLIKDNNYVKCYFGVGAGIKNYTDQSFFSIGPHTVFGVQLPIEGLLYWLAEGWESLAETRFKICIEADYMPTLNINTSSHTIGFNWDNFTINVGLGMVYFDNTSVSFYNNSKNKQKAYKEKEKIPKDFVFVESSVIKNFYICNHEVTQFEYEKYCCYSRTSPEWTGDNLPVINVSWYDTLVYCNLRSIAEGLDPCYAMDGETDPRNWENIYSSQEKYSYNAHKTNDEDSYVSENNIKWDAITCNFYANGYRLPKEYEWKYAAMGGKFSRGYYYSGSNFAFGVAWSENNSNDRIHSVKQKVPNELRIYDMTGNVSEWCWDWGSHSAKGEGRTIFGGCFKSVYPPSVSEDSYERPYKISNSIGFRVVRTAE